MRYVQAKGGLLVPDRRLRVPGSPTRQRGFLSWGPAFLRKPSSGGDPYWANVVSLLHFDGSDGDTDFTDQIGHVWTPHGAIALSAAQSKFGTTSLAVAGAGEWLTCLDPDGTAFLDFSTSDYTLEAWVFPTGNTGWSPLINKRGSQSSRAAAFLRLYPGAELQGGVASGTTWYETSSSASPLPLNQWSHVAAVRHGTLLSCYASGTLTASETIPYPLTIDSDALASPLAIGALGNGDDAGLSRPPLYIDEVRISAIARYTSNFTPPTEPFPDHA